MKAKVIFFGWYVSWLFLFAGVGTWETSEFGSMKMILGILLSMIWVAFSLLLIQYEKECEAECDRLEKWIDKHIFNSKHDG